MLSYKFRKMGFRLLRDNTLLFVQGFSKSESSLLGNLEKEYVYGKTQAGVVFHHGLFVFSKTRSSPGLLRRTLHRVTKPVFTASVLISLMYSVLGSTISGVLILSSLIMARLVFFSWLCAKSSLKLTFTERFMASIIGLATDFVYSVGIACGVLLSLLHKRL